MNMYIYFVMVVIITHILSMNHVYTYTDSMAFTFV